MLPEFVNTPNVVVEVLFLVISAFSTRLKDAPLKDLNFKTKGVLSNAMLNKGDVAFFHNIWLNESFFLFKLSRDRSRFVQ